VILFGSENTGGKVGDGTGWGVGFIEVYEKFVIFFFRHQITARRVGLVLAGWVPKTDKEGSVVFLVDVKPVVISIEFE